MKHRTIYRAVFLCYCLLMIWLLFFRDRPSFDPTLPYSEQLKWNLVPFETVRLFSRLLDSTNPAFRRLAIVNLGGNILMFIPLGFLLPGVFPRLRTLRSVLFTTAGIIVAVELVQLFTLVGSCDTDDLLLNVLGSAVGFLFYRSIQKNACSGQ